MASVESPRSWVPYESTKDCSQGFCSIYCPQWCYIIFPPPPPFEFSDGSSSGPTLSPLVIAIIGILASAFLLISYYTIVSKYCGSFESLRRRMNLGGSRDDDNDDVAGEGGQMRHHDSWRVTVNDGLEESVIRSIAVCKYKKGDGFVDSSDCSVCLAEFKEDESLRLLPKCSHAFHVRCIDTWLKSHSNCPLCRAVVVTPIATVPSQPPVTPVEQEVVPIQVSNETVISMEEMERGGQQENVTVPKDPRTVHGELGDGITEIEADRLRPIRRSFSMDASCHDRVLIADVLEMGTEDCGPSAATSGGEGSSSQIAEEQNKGRSKALHSVISPVRMKRSFSSGRFNIHKHGRGNNTSSVLPM